MTDDVLAIVRRALEIERAHDTQPIPVRVCRLALSVVRHGARRRT